MVLGYAARRVLIQFRFDQRVVSVCGHVSATLLP